MSQSNGKVGVLLLSGLLLFGCVSQVTERAQYSGFIPDYARLKQATSPSGHPVMRWIDPDFKPRSYSTIVFDKLQLYPSPKPNERIDQQTLQALQAYATASAKETMALRYQVVPSIQSASASGQAMVIKAAITGVSASNEGMKWYEVVPVAAVVGATSAATGHRDQNTELYLEAMVNDGTSGKPLLYVVRKVFGETLKNDKQAITVDDFKAAIKQMNSDLSIMLN